jgi:hypothetical protein
VRQIIDLDFNVFDDDAKRVDNARTVAIVLCEGFGRPRPPSDRRPRTGPRLDSGMATTTSQP